MSSARGYSPASDFGSTSPGSTSSSTSADLDLDRDSTSDTASPGNGDGSRHKLLNTRTASCDACIKSKRACDLLDPCHSCQIRHIACTYTAVDPQARLRRILAIETADVERTIALRNLRIECDFLTRRIDDLKTRLGLSDQELDHLQQLANEHMLADKPRFDQERLANKSALMAAAAPTARRRRPFQTARAPPSPPRSALGALAAAAVACSPFPHDEHPPQRPHKRSRSVEGASSVDENGLERDGADSADEMPPPRTAPTRRQPLRASTRRASLPRSTPALASAPTATDPPPLPPFDPSGRPYPAAPYHFPRTYEMPPQTPMPAPPAWMSPLLPTLYPVLPVPHGHRSWDTPRVELRGISSPTSASLELGLGLNVEESLRAHVGARADRGGGDAWSRGWGRRWIEPALDGSRRGTMFETGSRT
ncbi:hypothetical protein JCM8208_006978 [Rhodotorula glutinis]